MAFARLNGIVIHHRLIGPERAPAIAFSNALGTDFRIWDSVAAALQDRYRLLLYDTRGHGLSQAPVGPYALADHTADLKSLLDHAGIEHVALVGLSVGGLIAQDFAAHHPERTVAAILSNTAQKIGTPEVWAERMAAVEAGGIESLADATMQRWFTPAFHRDRSAELAGYRAMLTRQSTLGYLGTCASIRDADLTASTRTLRLPVLCIAGDQDGSTPADRVRSLAELIQGSQFRIIEGAGHISCVERPDAVVDLVASFLSAVGHR